ncbi:MAG: hypothetical protein GC146_05260 [Limimaricola sp.]|uniref:hypothetical protein n=1 Tax=Limimaricola sp. TaxID=2211665 RepID=UPI001DEE1792|nr:hypothetical protein [Limimaricola sp.]MBI1416615.1 hypothetical protein [Limimaricola sp.]
MTAALARDGFAVLAQDARVLAWAEAARPAALAVLSDPEMRARWLRHGGTWFVGVDALPNGPDGRIGGVPLAGSWDGLIGPLQPLHRAQLSVTWPGYPRRDPDESEAAHRFRLKRDAAHLDGLLAEGPQKRRFLREPHAWILGLPLTPTAASPLVVWAGSHEVIRAAFKEVFAGRAPADWASIDVTEAYAAARAEVVETCQRVEVPLMPGQAVVMHRLAIHGVAPWAAGAEGPREGRMVAYFRPLLADPGDWLALP